MERVSVSTRFFGDLGARWAARNVSNCVASRGCGSLGDCRSSLIESNSILGFRSFRGKGTGLFRFGGVDVGG